jgi:protein involved in polysaccharide export with SLBB domain
VRGIGDVSLAGVLRSELQQHMTKEVGRIRREPDVVATPLIRLGVLGRVVRPGFYALPVDAPLTDAIMLAGGPAPDGDISRTVVRREGREAHNAAAISKAFAAGVTLDGIDLRAGDEIVVGERRTRNWQGILQATTLIIGVVVSVIALR